MATAEPDSKKMRLAEDDATGDIADTEPGKDLTSIEKLEKITNDYEEKFLGMKKGKEGEIDDKAHGSKDDQGQKNTREPPANEAVVEKPEVAGPNTDCIDKPFSSSITISSGNTTMTSQATITAEKPSSIQSKIEHKTSLQNGSGQKLESIIGRLASDRSVNALLDNDEEPVLCKADAATQTFPDFVKIVKCLVFRRMKQLEQSLIGGAVTDSVLNGKLVELQKENKELRKNSRILQEKLDVIAKAIKSDENITVSKVKDVIDNMNIQSIPMETGGTTSPIRRQSAVVSPYHVHGASADLPLEEISVREVPRQRRDVVEIQRTQAQAPTTSNIIPNDHTPTNAPVSVQYHTLPRQGPQVKYVPHKIHQGPPGAAPSQQFIHLSQGGVVMQKIPGQQRPQVPGMEYGPRQPSQMIYTTQPVQVTGPRMSTIPPQPQQSGQHANRPILSPSGMNTRLSQPGQIPRQGGNLVRLQGSTAQTVHYIPQSVMPGYMQQIPHNISPSGHRMGTLQELRGQLPQQGPAHLMPPDYRIRPGPGPQPMPPPPYQVPRVQLEPPNPPKLQVNITVSGNGIVLSWDFESEPPSNSQVIECYHLFASQDSPNPPTSKSDWKKIGVVKALPLPMACTLTQFVSGNSYHFAVLAVDVNGREGQMSNPCTVRLNK